jgi:GntR family transcriptional repressor for pyruvate dehydrogenase complex
VTASAAAHHPRFDGAVQGASQRVAARVRHFVEREGLVPGDFIGREGDLAARFGVSRPTMREALKLLSSGHLIRASKGPGGGIFVAHTPDKGMSRSVSDAVASMLETGTLSLEELLDARLMLEVPVAGRVAVLSDPATIERLQRAVAAEREAARDDLETFAASDAEIHRALSAGAHNRMVEALMGWSFEVLQPSLIELLDRALVRSAVVEQHEALLACIEARDAVGAQRAMRAHLLYLRNVLRVVRRTSS